VVCIDLRTLFSVFVTVRSVAMEVEFGTIAVKENKLLSNEVSSMLWSVTIKMVLQPRGVARSIKVCSATLVWLRWESVSLMSLRLNVAAVN